MYRGTDTVFTVFRAAERAAVAAAALMCLVNRHNKRRDGLPQSHYAAARMGCGFSLSIGCAVAAIAVY